MTKLNERKIRWIMRELENGNLSIGEIASVQHVTPRRIRQLREYKRKTGQVFRLKKERIVCKRITTPEEIKVVVETWTKYRSGSTFLEKIIDRGAAHTYRTT